MKAPIGTFDNPDVHFDHIHSDIVGPLPSSNNHKYLLTCIDKFARWPEAIPIPDITAETITSAFLYVGFPTLVFLRLSQRKTFQYFTVSISINHIMIYLFKVGMIGIAKS